MDVQLLTYIIVGAAFALYIAIALWSRASSTGEFYVASNFYLYINDWESNTTIRIWL